MKTKQKIVLKSIDSVSKRILWIKAVLEAKPLSEICNIRIEANKLLEENKRVDARTSKEFAEKIKDLAEREKYQFKIAEKQKNSAKLINELVELESELFDLNNELSHIQRNK